MPITYVLIIFAGLTMCVQLYTWTVWTDRAVFWNKIMIISAGSSIAVALVTSAPTMDARDRLYMGAYVIIYLAVTAMSINYIRKVNE